MVLQNMSLIICFPATVWCLLVRAHTKRWRLSRGLSSASNRHIVSSWHPINPPAIGGKDWALPLKIPGPDFSNPLFFLFLHPLPPPAACAGTPAWALQSGGGKNLEPVSDLCVTQPDSKTLFWKLKGASNIIWKQAVSLDAFLRYSVGGKYGFCCGSNFFSFSRPSQKLASFKIRLVIYGNWLYTLEFLRE